MTGAWIAAIGTLLTGAVGLVFVQATLTSPLAPCAAEVSRQGKNLAEGVVTPSARLVPRRELAYPPP